MPSKTHMSPVAKHIRKTFEIMKQHNDDVDSISPIRTRPTPMCKRVPFDIWMNDYLFPELLLLGDSMGSVYSGRCCHNWACYYLPEETILRIMCEAGTID